MGGKDKAVYQGDGQPKSNMYENAIKKTALLSDHF